MGEHLRKGVVNLDKPMGPTSHEVTAWVRDMLGASKAGHTGTLDPRVCGVLPILLERAVGLIPAFLEMPKEYVCLAHLHGDVPGERLREVVAEFTGPIYQRPPLHSAVEKRTRSRTIHELEILEERGPEVLLRVQCQAGTYIRKLVHDMGEALGPGAHMVQLRRTLVGPYGESGAVTLQELADAVHAWKETKDEAPLRRLVQPLESAVSPLARVTVRESAVDSLCHGADLAAPGVVHVEAPRGIRRGETVALVTPRGELIGLGTALHPQRAIEDAAGGIVVKTRRVFLEPGAYPKGWQKRSAAPPA